MSEAANEGLEQFNHIDGLVDAIRGISDRRDERRLIFATGENTRHLRHDQVLRRWPVLTRSATICWPAPWESVPTR